MKNRILSLLLVLTLLISTFTFTIPVNAEDSVTAFIDIISHNFAEGSVSASISLSDEADAVLFMCYYNSDGTMLTHSSFTPTTDEQTFTLETPKTVSTGDYVKLIVVKNDNLEPIAVSGETLVHCSDLFDMEFSTPYYQGISERYYTISSENGSIAVEKYSATNALGRPVTRRRIIASDTGTPFRLKDMAEGEFSFEDYESPRYRLEYTTAVGVSIYTGNNAAQRWSFEKDSKGIAICHSSGKYLAISEGAVTLSDEKYYWKINYYGETPFTQATTLDGFALLSEHEQQRFIEICTSVGADIFPYEAVSMGNSYLSKCEASFSSLYLNSTNLTPEQEKAELLSIISKPVFTSGDIVSYHTISDSFPEGDATITCTNPVKRRKVIWDVVQVGDQYYTNSTEHPYTGAAIDCYLIKVTYTTENSTQTIDVYCTDPDFVNVDTAIKALGEFPYEYRQYIETMYVYLSNNTSTYNCGGKELFVRLTGEEPDVPDMVKHIAHELGHSLDFCVTNGIDNYSDHWCQSDEWQNALTDDIVTVSTYGNSNHCEGLAEVARLYWYCYNRRDMQIGIRQMFPNLFASYEELIKAAGVNPLY